jgi:D-sedoheptulose 7-phosphate isomerase
VIEKERKKGKEERAYGQQEQDIINLTGGRALKNIILSILEDSIDVKQRFFSENLDSMIKAGEVLASCLASGHKILIFGNGGSAADAQHIAAEFVNRFQIERPPMAALALTTDTSVITSIGNDYHFDDIFSKQVSALGRKDDVAVGISTSGNSRNVIKAVHAAKDIGMYTIGLTGGGGELAMCADLAFSVQSDITARIQEVHITLGHILCDLVDRILFPEKF